MFELAQASAKAGSKTLLAAASARFEPGRVTAILGPNGAGKSTLLSLLAGLREPAAGQVLLDGLPLASFTPATLALRRAVMAQESQVAFDFTAREVVELGRYPHRRRPSRDEAGIVTQALAASVCGGFAGQVFGTLSGGEKARVQLARAMAQVWEPLPGGSPRWLLLDEPTAALDLAHQHHALRLVRNWAKGQGVGVIAVLHDLNLALRYADDALLLAGGQASCFGPVREVLDAERISRVWQLPCEPVSASGGVPQFLFA